MNKLTIIRNNLLAKGILDAQLSILLLDLEQEYTGLINDIVELKLRVNQLEEAKAEQEVLDETDNGSSPVEEGNDETSNANAATAELKETVTTELEDTNNDDAVANAEETVKDKGNLGFKIGK